MCVSGGSPELFAIHRQRKVVILWTSGFRIGAQKTAIHAAAEVLTGDPIDPKTFMSSRLINYGLVEDREEAVETRQP
jgi:hypothetical protein